MVGSKPISFGQKRTPPPKIKKLYEDHQTQFLIMDLIPSVSKQRSWLSTNHSLQLQHPGYWLGGGGFDLRVQQVSSEDGGFHLRVRWLEPECCI